MDEKPPINYTEYPRSFSEPRIRLETITEAWRFLTAQMGVWVLATLCMLGLTLLLGAPLYILAFMQLVGKAQPSMQDMLLFYAISFPAVILVYVGQAIGFAGMYSMALRQIQGQSIAIKDFFHTGSSLWSHIGAGFLVSIAVLIGSMACYIPGFMLGGLLLFTQPIIIHQKVGAFAAMSQSWNMLKSQLVMAAVFYFLISMVAGLGAILCGVGILFSYPLYPLAVSLVYRDHLHALYGTPAPGPSPDLQ
jgi:hypothetical protein